MLETRVIKRANKEDEEGLSCNRLVVRSAVGKWARWEPLPVKSL